ncbi:sugar ABC transporter ATP-binding protein [Brevibacillus sp. SYSU BS000544]|uniref:sugar ABC transporter ATP-binding protein n=1 Tax=Brevibacillus sp. SYSU BS000544 TaxID=3416443 RepID=UPI003CE503DA
MATLQMRRINKRFSGVSALRSVDFEVKQGEVHSLLGANGAGKSTLMKILMGAYQADEGEILMDGQVLQIDSPIDAKRSGISIVYQEVDMALIPYLSVAENILVDQFVQATKRGPIKWSKLYQEAEEILERLDFSLSVRKKAEECSLSEKQLILIARSIAQEAKYIIFDEPTAPLSSTESERLFELIAQLKQNGVGIIYISHRLPEVFRISDRISVMRDGQRISTKEAGDTTMDAVIHDMLGHSLMEEFPERGPSVGELLFEARGITLDRKVRDVNLQIHAGEVVAIVGLVGAGKTELARILFAADPLDKGEFYLRGQQIKVSTPREAVQQGIVLIPEERRKEGLLVEETVKHNLSISTLKKWTTLSFIKQGSETTMAKGLVEKLGIKTAGIEQQVSFLSGGNQQKVVIGKWLYTDSELYLFDEPTKGVDIGAKREIYSLVGELAAQQKGVLYFTCEFQEALGIADRILVMYDGAIVKEISQEEWDPGSIMYYASGGR